MKALSPLRDPDLDRRFQAAYTAAKAASSTLDGPSLAARFAGLAEPDRAAILASLSTLDRARLRWAWPFWARPKQRAPRDAHRIWLLCGGRGMGKSRTGAERIRERVYQGARSIALVGPTLREIGRYMIGGHAGEKGNGSGLLDVFPPHQRPVWNQIKGEVHFHTGAVAYVVTAEDAEYRGGNVDTVWCDEIMKWEPGRRRALWDNIELSLRSDSGLPVEIVVTTTPTTHPFLKELVADPDCITYLGSTDENAANLEAGFLRRLDARFGESRKGRQERRAEILSEVEGALFSQAMIESTRWYDRPKLKRIAVAVDPAISVERGIDPTGIVGGGRGDDDHLYLLAHREGKWRPEEWAAIALDMRAAIGAECIVGERNRGGDMVASQIKLVSELRARERGTVSAVRVEEVWATRRKEVRAEEAQTLHEQGRLHFPPDGLPELEEQITSWDPRLGGRSPNGLDALVWLAFYLYDGFGESSNEAAARKAAEVAAQATGLGEMNRRIRPPIFSGGRV